MAGSIRPATGVIRLGATLGIALAAGAAFAWPALAGVLIYERTEILAGQAWRLWTGHLVHYTASHLLWDLLVFLAAGLWLEHIAPRLARAFYLIAPPVISGALLWGEPALQRYAGLSGLAAGVLVLLALVQLRPGTREPRWFWLSVLALVAVKVAVESTTHGPLLSRFDAGVTVVPLAHEAGIACAVVAFLVARRMPGLLAGA